VKFSFLDILGSIFPNGRFKNPPLLPAGKFNEHAVEYVRRFKFRERRTKHLNRKLPFPYLPGKKIQTPLKFGNDHHGFKRESRQALVIGGEFRGKHSKPSVRRSYSTAKLRRSERRTANMASGITGCFQPRFANCQ
jgi:hypothetical protein